MLQWHRRGFGAEIHPRHTFFSPCHKPSVAGKGQSPTTINALFLLRNGTKVPKHYKSYRLKVSYKRGVLRGPCRNKLECNGEQNACNNKALLRKQTLAFRESVIFNPEPKWLSEKVNLKLEVLK